MASIFPTTPNPGETFTVGTTTYQWTGSAWLKVNSVSTGSSTLGSLTVTTVLSVTSSVASTSTTSGALQISGGIGIGKNIVIGTTATILGTAVSTSTTTGALIVIGGVGIGGSVNVSGNLSVTGYSTLGLLTATVFTATSSNILGNESVGGKLTVTGYSTLGLLTATVFTATSANIIGNETVSGTLTVNSESFLKGVTATIITATSLVIVGTTTATSTTTGVITVAGGIGAYNAYLSQLNVNNYASFAGPVTFGNDVTFSGTATYVLSTNTYYTDNLLELHVPPAGVYTPWTYPDGKDIGLRFHYYNRTASTDSNAALVLADDSQYLEWYGSGAEAGTGTFIGATYGTFKTGVIQLAGGNATNNASSGDLQVTGGVGIGGGLFVANSVTASILTLVGTTVASSTNTGALIVAGGAGVAGKLYVGGDINAVSNVVLNDTAVVHNATGISVGISTTTIDTFSTLTYRSAKYVVSVSNSSINQYQTSEILVVQNGSNSYLQSTSVFSSATFIMSFVTSVVGNNVVLQGTGIAAGNTVKVQKIYITI